jgi:hypothetical protein
MNQNVGAYLDCFLSIVIGFGLLFFAPVIMRKGGKTKYIKMVKIAAVVILVIGLIRLAGKLFGWDV